MKNSLVENNSKEDIHYFFIFNSFFGTSEYDLKRIEICIRLCEILVQDYDYFEDTLSQLLIVSSLHCMTINRIEKQYDIKKMENLASKNPKFNINVFEILMIYFYKQRTMLMSDEILDIYRDYKKKFKI